MGQRIGRGGAKPVQCAPLNVQVPVSTRFQLRFTINSEPRSDRRGANVLRGEPKRAEVFLTMSFADLGLTPGLIRAVTDKGYDILSKGMPYTADEVEKLMAEPGIVQAEEARRPN